MTMLVETSRATWKKIASVFMVLFGFFSLGFQLFTSRDSLVSSRQQVWWGTVAHADAPTCESCSQSCGEGGGNGGSSACSCSGASESCCSCSSSCGSSVCGFGS